VILVRYADDFLVSVKREEDTEMILKAIKQRFKKFGLELSEEKTQVVKFGRYWKESDNDTGSKTGTFKVSQVWGNKRFTGLKFKAYQGVSPYMT
jgi:hypothetical protein